jgi:hypothetical protein
LYTTQEVRMLQQYTVPCTGTKQSRTSQTALPSDSSFAPHSSAPLHLPLLEIFTLYHYIRIGAEVFWLSVLGSVMH